MVQGHYGLLLSLAVGCKPLLTVVFRVKGSGFSFYCLVEDIVMIVMIS